MGERGEGRIRERRIRAVEWAKVGESQGANRMIMMRRMRARAVTTMEDEALPGRPFSPARDTFEGFPKGCGFADVEEQPSRA